MEPLDLKKILLDEGKWEMDSPKEFVKFREALKQKFTTAFIHMHVNDFHFAISCEEFDYPHRPDVIPVLKVTNGFVPICTDHMKEISVGIHGTDLDSPYPLACLDTQTVSPSIRVEDFQKMDYMQFYEAAQKCIISSMEKLYQKGEVDKETILHPATDFWKHRNKFFQEYYEKLDAYATLSFGGAAPLPTYEELMGAPQNYASKPPAKNIPAKDTPLPKASTKEIQDNMMNSLTNIAETYQDEGVKAETIKN